MPATCYGLCDGGVVFITQRNVGFVTDHSVTDVHIVGYIDPISAARIAQRNASSRLQMDCTIC